MTNESERLHILDMIEIGQISAGEGIHLLEALAGEDGRMPEENPAAISNGVAPAGAVTAGAVAADTEIGLGQEGFRREADAATLEEPLAGGKGQLPFDMEGWRRWWKIPLWIGVGITLAGALLMYSALQASGVSLWLFFAGVPFLIGVGIMALAWQIPSAHWLHLRIEQRSGEWPQRIAISFPLPIRLAAWVVRNFGHRIPNLQGSSAEEIILGLGKSASPENPIIIDVDEGEHGERVQIFIT
jgi:hypothetical protein